jgi:hypothetical protein
MNEHEPSGDYLTNNGRLLDTIKTLIEAYFASLPANEKTVVEFSDQPEGERVSTSPGLDELDYTNIAMAMKELDDAFERALLQNTYGEAAVDILMLDYRPERISAAQYKAASHFNVDTEVVFFFELLSLYDKTGTLYAQCASLQKSDGPVTETVALVHFNREPAAIKRKVEATEDALTYGREESDAMREGRKFAHLVGLDAPPSRRELQDVVADLRKLPGASDIDI